MAAFGIVPGLIWFLWSGGNFLPRWIDWKNETCTAEAGRYKIVLSRKTVQVTYDSEIIWTSPKDVKVQDALCHDIDGDGIDEIVLLCWKKGRFGRSKPFWVDQDETTQSQHVFVYACDSGAIRPKWMSSYIGQDIAQMEIVGRKTGGRTLQGKEIICQHLLLTDPEGQMSSWIWDSWGFTKEDTEISFIVFGDNLIHEPIYQYGLYKAGNYSLNDGSTKSAGNFDFLFENIRDVIQSSDVAVINQEAPLTDQPENFSGFPRFGTPVGVGQAIIDAGFDVVTCATNHALDQGVKGVSFTKNFFDSHDVMSLGIQSETEKEYRPYRVLVRGGAHFALFNYTYGLNENFLPAEKVHMVHLLTDEERIKSDLAAAKAEADIVLVFVHWGTEYAEQPDNFQKKWTEVFLESGVDAVIGTHPHALQPYERLRDDNGHEMLVYYSLGNYVSAQQEQSCVKGGMARFTAALTPSGYKIVDETLVPLVITRQEDGKYTVDFEN